MLQKETSKAEDDIFKGACKGGTITCLEAVKYLRKPNTREWKRYVVIMLLPEHIREAVSVQCKLEELI